MNLISNCPLCGQHSLHVVENQISQCLHCGYVTSEKFQIIEGKCEEYNKLPDDMQKMSKTKNNQYWIPSVMTLPMGLINPILVDDNMFWAFSPMVEIPKDEQKNYPNGEGGFYENKYDQSKTKLFKDFYIALETLNEEYKPNETKIKLPKLNIHASPNKS